MRDETVENADVDGSSRHVASEKPLCLCDTFTFCIQSNEDFPLVVLIELERYSPVGGFHTITGVWDENRRWCIMPFSVDGLRRVII